MDSRTRPLIGWRNLAIRRRHLLRCHFFLHFCVCVFSSFFFSLPLLSTKISAAMCRRGMMSRLRSSFIFLILSGPHIFLSDGIMKESARHLSPFFLLSRLFYWLLFDQNWIRMPFNVSSITFVDFFFLNWGRCRV